MIFGCPRFHDGRVGHMGFTLIELLVVIAVLALMIGLVPVAYGKLKEGSDYRDTVRSLAAGLRAARQKSLSTGADTLFEFSASERTYGPEGKRLHVIPESIDVTATLAAAQAEAGMGVGAVRFLSSGGATGGSFDVLRPSGTGTRVRVDWLTGRIELEAISP